MRAAVIHTYGGPEVFRFEDVPSPTLGHHDILLEAHASSVNPIDTKIRAGGQRGAVRYRLPWILGLDVSGVVMAAGAGVTKFKVGDQVYASPTHRRPGCYAEKVAVHENEAALKPSNLTHAEAATLPLVGLTALGCLQPRLQQRRGQRVHVQAGAGGVGTFAIQLARIYGATVSTTCSAKNADLVRDLGASNVIDYREQDFSDVVNDCDLVLESIGGENWRRALLASKRGGQVASINAGLPNNTKRYGPNAGVLITGLSLLGYMLRGLWRGVRVRNVMRVPDGQALSQITAWVEAGLIVPVVDRITPLARLAEAHIALETGGIRGKIAIGLTG